MRCDDRTDNSLAQAIVTLPCGVGVAVKQPTTTPHEGGNGES